MPADYSFLMDETVANNKSTDSATCSLVATQPCSRPVEQSMCIRIDNTNTGKKAWPSGE